MFSTFYSTVRDNYIYYISEGRHHSVHAFLSKAALNTEHRENENHILQCTISKI